MTKEEFISKITELKPGDPYSIYINELFNAFGYKNRKGSHIHNVVVKLQALEIDVEENNLKEGNIYSKIVLKKKNRLMSACKSHILIVRDIESAHSMPVCVKENDTLDYALTLMQKNNFSQLPVLRNKKNEISGIISWETIGVGLINKCSSNTVKEFMSKQYKQVNDSLRLMDVVALVYDNDFVLVTDTSNALCGILTTYDLSIRFKEWVQPFILVGEIEKALRLILNNVYVDEKEKPYLNRLRDVHSLDSLSFGECVNLIDDDVRWKKLCLYNTNRTEFINMLKDINDIRNKTAHYAIIDETRDLNKELDKLKFCVKYLHNICKYRNIIKTN